MDRLLFSLDGSPLTDGGNHAPQARLVPTDRFVQHQGDGQERLSAEAGRRGVPEQGGKERPTARYIVRLPGQARESAASAIKREEVAEISGPPSGFAPLEPQDLDEFFGKGATQADQEGATERPPFNFHDKRFGSTWDRGRKAKPTDYTDKIVSISYTHEAIMAYMIAFPHHGLREIGSYFGYSQTWLSQLINSDLFRAKLKERQDEHFSKLSATIVEKIEAAAHVGIEKLGNMLEKSEDPKFVKDATSDLLAKMGFGAPRSSAGVSINAPGAQMVISTTDLAEARALMQAKGQVLQLPAALPTKVVNES